MQTLQFWNSIKECGLPALVHKTRGGFCSEDVFLVDEHSGYCTIESLYQSGPTDDPKLQWKTEYLLTSIPTFTHWAYIPAVPKKEEK